MGDAKRRQESGHYPAVQRPTVLGCCLCGSERQSWVNPPQVGTLISMSHDSRFAVTIKMVSDLRSFDSARNFCVDAARKGDADFLVMMDNDVCPRISPLEIIAQMAPDMSVVGLAYGITAPDGLRLSSVGQHETRGDFVEVDAVGAGCLILRSEVWKRLPGPWFVWTPQRDELLSPGVGEDIAFCRLVREHGFRVWSHRMPAAHFRTTDLTEIIARRG